MISAQDVQTGWEEPKPAGEPQDESLHYARIEGRRHPASQLAASVAAWLAANQERLIECQRHNGRARLTAAACAERHRRARGGWVDTLRLNPDKRHLLKMSFAVCATCPVGAFLAREVGRTDRRRRRAAAAVGLAACGSAAGPPPLAAGRRWRLRRVNAGRYGRGPAPRRPRSAPAPARWPRGRSFESGLAQGPLGA
jgi:hypothetical protein